MHKLTTITAVTTALVAGFGWYRFEFQPERIEDRKTTSATFSGQAVGSAPDFANISNVTAKKQAFFDYLRPGVNLENQRIQKERARLLRIQANLAQETITAEDTAYAQRLGQLYSVTLTTEGVTAAWLSSMLERVNVLPEALVMTQAANESAWGTSRFATKANNYFGQWCYKQGCGLVPLQRNDGAAHEVAKFSSVQESIHRYFMNVNRNRAYIDLRVIRLKLANEGESLVDTDAAISLTNGLLRYSERGEAYVKDLQAMIAHNDKFWTNYNDQNIQ